VVSAAALSLAAHSHVAKSSHFSSSLTLFVANSTLTCCFFSLSAVRSSLAAVLCPPQELSEDELVQVLTGPKNALTKQYKQLFSLNKAGFGVTQSALRAIARKAIDKGTGTRSLRSIMEGLLIEVMYHVPEQGPAAAEAGNPIAVLLDEESVNSGAGARIVAVEELERVIAADAAAAAADSGSMSDGGASDGGEPIAAEVR
jgi:hypothetical protein